jgi:hypothetical protein
VSREGGIDPHNVVAEHSSPGKFSAPELTDSMLPEIRSVLDYTDGNAIGDDTEGHTEFSQRVLVDPWSEPAARRAIGFAAAQKLCGAEIALIRVDPYPIEATGHSLAWLCFGDQDEIDNWRFTDLARIMREGWRM